MTIERHEAPLLEQNIDKDLEQILQSGQGGPTQAQLDSLAAKLAPALALPLAELSGASPATGVAPAAPGTAAVGGGGVGTAAAGTAQRGRMTV